LGEELVEEMDGVVEEKLVGLAGGEVELAAQFRAKRRPVLLQDQPQIVLPPLRGNGVIDLAGLRVPERDRPAIFATGSEGSVPGAPLFARHGEAVAAA